MKSGYKDHCIFSIFDKKPKFLLDLEEEKKEDSFDLDDCFDDLNDFHEVNVINRPSQQAVPPSHFLSQDDNPYRIHKTYDTVGKKVKTNANYTKSVETKEINQTTSDSDDFEII
jgi:hypothetical protein